MTTPSQARDEITALFTTEWPAAAATIAGQAVPIYYDDKAQKRPSADDVTSHVKFWCAISVQHDGGGQESLGGEDGTSRYGLDGLVFVQIFCPMGVGLTVADQLAELAMSIFRGVRAGGVTFRNQRMKEVGNSGPWSQTNVSAGMQYQKYQ